MQVHRAAQDEFESDESLEPEELEPVALLAIPDKPKEVERTSISRSQFECCTQHSFSGVLHILVADDELACSRRVSKNFKKPDFSFNEAHSFPLCLQCAAHG